MGFSTYAFAAALLAVSYLFVSSITNVHDTLSADDLRAHAGTVRDSKASSISIASFNSTNMTGQLKNITLYVKNTGSLTMQTHCVDAFINSDYIDPANTSSTVRPGLFNPHLWNPAETLVLELLHEIPVGEHNATVISCLGDSDTMAFNASMCGDGICHGGEYCGLDDDACTAGLICHVGVCGPGCSVSLTPAGETDDSGDQTCNEFGGCETDSCVCDGEGGCCGAGGSVCQRGTDCCSGSCPPPGPVKYCAAFP